MAARNIPKATPKDTIIKTNTCKAKSSPAKATKAKLSPTKAIKAKLSPTKTIKKSSTTKTSMSGRNTAERIPLKVAGNQSVGIRQRTNTVPKVSVPKPSANSSVPIPSSVTKSVKKPSWKRRPKPAHSGVPVPEKMRKLLEKDLNDSDTIL